MIIVCYYTILLASFLLIEAVAENGSSQLSNDIGDISKISKVESVTISKSSDLGEKSRQSRYLRRFHRPTHRLSTNFPMKNMRRPWKDFNSYGKAGNTLNAFNRPYRPGHNYNRYNSISNHLPRKHRNNPFKNPWPSKQRFGNGKHNWRNKWPPESGRFSSLMSFPQTNEDNGEPYDEYTDMYEYGRDEEIRDELPTDELGESAYNEADEDALPVPSRYSEKRSPVKYSFNGYSSFSDSLLPPKISKDRTKFNTEENIPRYSHFYRKYRPRDSQYSSNIHYQDPVTLPTRSRNHNYRFKLINLSGMKMQQNSDPNRDEEDDVNDDFNTDEDKYDFSDSKSLNYKKQEHLIRLNDENFVRYNSNIGQRDSFKDIREENNYAMKNRPLASPQNIQDVVYSSRYRNNRVRDDEYVSEKSTYPDQPKRSRKKQNKIAVADTNVEDEFESSKNNNDDDDSISQSTSASTSESNDLLKKMRQRQISKNTVRGSTQTNSLLSKGDHHQVVTPNADHEEVVKTEDDRLLPSELIAYMSVNPSEPVINKEERFTVASHPFIRTQDAQFIKPLGSSVTANQDVEINLDQYQILT